MLENIHYIQYCNMWNLVSVFDLAILNHALLIFCFTIPFLQNLTVFVSGKCSIYSHYHHKRKFMTSGIWCNQSHCFPFFVVLTFLIFQFLLVFSKVLVCYKADLCVKIFLHRESITEGENLDSSLISDTNPLWDLEQKTRITCLNV